MKADLSKDIKERMAGAAYSPDGKWLAICRGGESNGLAGKVTLLDPATRQEAARTNPGHLDGATDLAFHPDDGKHIFSAGRDTTVKIWRASKTPSTSTRPRPGPRRSVQGLDLRHLHLPRRLAPGSRGHGGAGANLEALVEATCGVNCLRLLRQRLLAGRAKATESVVSRLIESKVR